MATSRVEPPLDHLDERRGVFLGQTLIGRGCEEPQARER
jgi:hypothetical protein